MRIRLFPLIAFLCADAIAQTTAGLMPLPETTFLDLNGLPVAGGKVCTYASGTSTPLATYTDSTGGTPAGNPVILDASGRASIWLGPSVYRIQLLTAGTDNTCSTGAQLWLKDGVTAPTLATSNIEVPSGHSFTMDAGSSAVINTNFAPGVASTYSLGTSLLPWTTLYTGTVSMVGPIVQGINNSYDIGGLSLAFRNAYAFATFVNQSNLCGVNGGSTLTSNCYSFNPTYDSNNNLLTLKDPAGTVIWKWSEKESSSSTNYVGAGLTLQPLANNTYNLGTSSFSWNTIYGSTLSLNGGGPAIELSQTTRGAHVANGSANTDFSGQLTVTSSTTGVLTFTTSYVFAPSCVVTPTSNPGAVTYWVTSTASTMTINLSGSSTITFNYVCTGNPV